MDLVEYLVKRGMKHEKAGVYYRICCPFHSERTPSFYIYRDNHAYCYGACQRSYDFVEVIYLLEFPGDSNRRRAFEKARELGAIPQSTITTTYRTPIVLPDPTPEQIEAMTIAFGVYHEMLLRRVGFRARQWLTETRGVKGPLFDQVMETLGYAPDGAQYHVELTERLRARFRDDWIGHATTTGLLSLRGSQRLRNRLFFAVLNNKRQVVFYQTRTIVDDPNITKYLNVGGIRKVPYEPISADAALYTGTWIVEGPMDAIAHGANGFYAKGLLGSRVPTLSALKALPHPIMLGLDNEDEEAAGPKARRQLIERCIEGGIPYHDGTTPRGVKDPSEFLSKVGPEQFVQYNAKRYLIAA